MDTKELHELANKIKESQEPCPACDNPSKLWDPDQRILISHFTNQKNGHPTFIIVQESEEDKGPQTVVIESNYCPWCGRKIPMWEKSSVISSDVEQ